MNIFTIKSLPIYVLNLIPRLYKSALPVVVLELSIIELEYKVPPKYMDFATPKPP